MRYPEFHYHWQWQLKSSPEELWPLVANTNRFDRDAGSPALEIKGVSLKNARLRLRQTKYGFPLEYTQEPYEWTYPYRYGVVRRYHKGLLGELRVLAEFTANDAGTLVDYHVWARAGTPIGVIGIPVQIGILFARSFEAGFRRFDQLVAGGKPLYMTSETTRFVPGGQKRMAAIRTTMLADGADPALLSRLIETIEQADPLSLSRLRPYALADYWGVNRRDVLKLCLLATRYGLLDFRWELLCPLCRGSRASSPTLSGITPDVHCDMCNIDFTVNFERSVELTFRPNPAIRLVEENEFCIGGPQDTPHVIVQQLLTPGERRTVTPVLEVGRYRLRSLGLRGGQYLSVTSGGAAEITLSIDANGWPEEEPELAPAPNLHFENQTGDEQLFILERVAWSDQAATAADVTMLQLFRDLFTSEALRPGEQIAVGKVAILFTDLRESTRLYYEIGDAPAFGVVMDHFDVLREAVVAEDGALVKTIGDSVMAVFRQPAAALRAALRAQQVLPPGLSIKAGIHYGPCIAVTLNERLDYFGSTVNIAARLEMFSQGDNIIISRPVYEDPEVADFLSASDHLNASPVETVLKGFGEQRFELWSVHE